MAFHVPNDWRVRDGPLATRDEDGNNGLFLVKSPQGMPMLAIVASDGAGWEHVSVSIPGNTKATPAWAEMDFVKRHFWDDTDCVAQLHVPRENWVNCHPGTLHLWRQIGAEFAQPPFYLVGPQREGKKQ